MNDVMLDFNDVLLVPKISSLSSRKEVSLESSLIGRHGSSLRGIPIIAANMDGVGTFSMNTELSKYGLFTAIRKSVSPNDWFDYAKFLDKLFDRKNYALDHAFISIGMADSEIQKLRILHDSKIFGDNLKICIDVANGYMTKFHNYISDIRNIFPNSFIVAGTVCTPEGAEKIVESGADLARVGIGSGAACLTRQIAGVGYPQFSAVLECSQNVDIVSDGGCVYPGDFAKAFAAGATMVMAGSIFAGHTEGEIEPFDNEVSYHGMSSTKAHPPITEWDQDIDYRASEGRIMRIPFKGNVKNTVQNILGGLRSACTYLDASNIADLSKNVEYIKVNNQLNHSLAHYTTGT